MRIVSIEARPLSVPLHEPFVIATGRIDTTRAALVVARVSREGNSAMVARGLGEAAALPPLTACDQPELVRTLSRAHDSLTGQFFSGPSQLAALLDDALGKNPVARAGAEAALLDAWARLEGVPVHVLLGSSGKKSVGPLITDITIPIADPTHMASLAVGWKKRGFSSFKLKVGARPKDDILMLEKMAEAVPGSRLRLDGNAGLRAGDAMSLIATARGLKLKIECFEQPCAVDDVEGMVRVTALAGCPVIADESVKSMSDLEHVIHHKSATGVNLKLVKHGGLVEAARIGRAAKRAGLKVMVGAMVETRLGLAAMAHVARSLGDVDFVDLDTAHLLKWDPFAGGYASNGAQLTLNDDIGLGVTEAPPTA